MGIKDLSLNGHYIVVNLGDNCDQEVEQYDQVKELVGEPDGPDHCHGQVLLQILGANVI